MQQEEIADRLFQYLGTVLYEPEKAKLDIDALPKEFHGLGKGLVFFAEMLGAMRVFAYELGRGNLAVTPPSSKNELAAPLKSLHANLKHLTWQAQRIAQGDYTQRVSFLGDFAETFNKMTAQLDEQRTALMDEIEAGKKKTNALEQSVSMFEAITLNVPQWIVVLEMDTANTLFINQTISGIFKTHPLLAANLQEWMEAQITLINEQDQGKTRVLDAEISTDEQNWFLSVSTYPLVWRNRQAMAFIFTDLSDERAQRQKLESVAYRDALTGVTSRYHGLSILEEWIGTHQEFCICFVDMDSLKYVNDVFGHAAGDDYIISVAKVLGSFSSTALVSRLGGDEFMLLQKNWSEQKVKDRMKGLRDELAQQPVPDNAYTRSISYGVVYVPKDNTTAASDLLSSADDRMYRFKRANKANR